MHESIRAALNAFYNPLTGDYDPPALKDKPVSSQHELSGRVARLRAAAGIADEEDLEHLVAKETGPDRYLLGGKVLTGDELRAIAEKQYEDDHKFDDVYRGLREPVRGLDLHQQAMRLLASRGNHSPSFEEYGAALEEVTS